MSRTAPDATARAIIDTIDHDAIEHVTYNPDDNETTVTFIGGTTITASEHCWDVEVTEDNVNGYSWAIHSPGDDPRSLYVFSSTHGVDLRDAIIKHANTITNHDRVTAVIGSWIDDNLPHDDDLFGADEGITVALADENLITADKVALVEAERNFVIDSLATKAHRASQMGLSDTRDAWKTAVDLFIAHTTTDDH